MLPPAAIKPEIIGRCLKNLFLLAHLLLNGLHPQIEKYQQATDQYNTGDSYSKE